MSSSRLTFFLCFRYYSPCTFWRDDDDDGVTSSAMDKPGTDLIGVTGGLDPLKTVVPTFTTKSIQQSSPLNGVLNTLTVTLVTDVDLAATSTVTIAGLTGTQTADAASLAITSTEDLLGTTAGWTKDSGTLVLTVGGTATTAGSDVVVTMVVTNKATAQDAVSPTVTAQANVSEQASKARKASKC